MIGFSICLVFAQKPITLTHAELTYVYSSISRCFIKWTLCPYTITVRFYLLVGTQSPSQLNLEMEMEAMYHQLLELSLQSACILHNIHFQMVRIHWYEIWMIIDHLLWEPSLSCRRRMASDDTQEITQRLRNSSTQILRYSSHFTNRHPPYTTWTSF